jgi:hypothetical protein
MDGATGVTDPAYIFLNNSFAYSVSGAPGRDLTVSDTANVGGTTLNPGDSFLLGRVSFAVGSPTAAGPVTIHVSTEAQGGSSLADPNGGTLNFTTRDGTITVGRATSVVPEPASLALCAFGGGILVLAGCLRRRPYAPCGV